MAEHNGFKRNVREPIGISEDGLTFVSEESGLVRYELVGVTTYKGMKNSIVFDTYIKEQRGGDSNMSDSMTDLNPRNNETERWLLYSGAKVFTTSR